MISCRFGHDAELGTPYYENDDKANAKKLEEDTRLWQIIRYYEAMGLFYSKQLKKLDEIYAALVQW